MSDSGKNQEGKKEWRRFYLSTIYHLFDEYSCKAVCGYNFGDLYTGKVEFGKLTKCEECLKLSEEENVE